MGVRQAYNGLNRTVLVSRHVHEFRTRWERGVDRGDHCSFCGSADHIYTVEGQGHSGEEGQ
jgi:hypothetical protein